MDHELIRRVPTSPFEGQRPGTSGLRKKTRVFMQPRYLENFIQSVFNCLREDGGADMRNETLVIGGDGRYFNRQAIQTIVRMAGANGFARVLVGRGGLLSTPALSAVIRRRRALGGILLSASHNPGGIDADFGVKYSARNGGPAPEKMTERIYRNSREIKEYLTLESPDLDLNSLGAVHLAGTQVEVIDPLADYTAVMESLFDFEWLRGLFRSGFRMIFDGMHGVTGPYARYILEACLGAPDGFRIVCRFSGTGTEGATLRLYFERFRTEGGPDVHSVLQPLIEAAHNLLELRDRLGPDRADVIT